MSVLTKILDSLTLMIFLHCSAFLGILALTLLNFLSVSVLTLGSFSNTGVLPVYMRCGTDVPKGKIKVVLPVVGKQHCEGNLLKILYCSDRGGS